MTNRVRSTSRAAIFDQDRALNTERQHYPHQVERKMPAWVRFGQHIPDLLTLSRVVLSLVLIGTALVNGRASLAQDVWILVLAWTTDMLDGRISRTFKKNFETWLGKNDVYVDMFLSISVLLYLAITGLLPLGLFAIYLFIWSALFIRWGIPPIFAQAFQNPIYAYFIFVTVKSEPSVLPWLLLWAAFAVLVFWRRMTQLMKSVVKTFSR